MATELFAQSCPGVVVDPDALYIDNGQILTSVGTSAGIDLCLHMIRCDHGTAVTSHAARLAVAHLHRSEGQAQFILRQPTYLPDRLLRRRPHLLEEATDSSVRTLNRRFQRETRQSPVDWLTGVRIRHAQELLDTTDRRVEHLARHVGFSTLSNFRK
ncbi:helix-turn-helix domain-containing protein [Dietzia sp. PP-33]|jgi:transcriptional regulator GlxA family with amidase domain|uniref:helix-turn-helix domain-containing protein n=1 Tax=Dietzia sp. PP-33 TaxID=2957500 RepID=UPI0029A71F03|nr:helix-turn-helix domain-containing protein [Dietzia sp. PP-33]MDX2356526.1 helix-turn-helix domain-containing protein [Dietzia sp. PP-33]